MSRKQKHLVTFERKAPTLDAFIAGTDEWVEVTKAYVSFESAVIGQKSEYQETAQTSSQRRSVVRAQWTPTMATVDTACRMKYGKLNPPKPEEPNDDANYRVFHIDQITNPGENNRELQFMVVERT